MIDWSMGKFTYTIAQDSSHKRYEPISQLPLNSLKLTKIDNDLTKIVLNNNHWNIFNYFCSSHRERIFVWKKYPRYKQSSNRLANAAPLELQSPLVTFVFFSRYQLPMSNKFTTFVPEIKWKRLRHSTLILSLLAYLLLCHLFMHIIGRFYDDVFVYVDIRASAR